MFDLVIVLIVGSFGGRQELVIAGTGFTDEVDVTICDKACAVTDVTPTQVTCTTPSAEEGMRKLTLLHVFGIN